VDDDDRRGIALAFALGVVLPIAVVLIVLLFSCEPSSLQG